MESSFRVLGVDPGLTRMGYGVVQQDGSSLRCLVAGTLSTPPGPAPSRLLHLHASLTDTVQQWSPDALALEKVFMKVNLKTGVGSIQAAGMAMVAAAAAGLEVAEYSPSQVKQAITGQGNASKEQVGFMVGRLLAGRVAPDGPDAADALALAITHLHLRRHSALAAHLPAARGRG